MAFDSNDPVVDGNATKGQRVFMPIPDPWQSDFDERLQQDVFDIVDVWQMHNPSHLPTYFKKASPKNVDSTFLANL